MIYARHFPYSSHEEFDFDIQTQTAGDSYARYQVRVAEFERASRSSARPWKKFPRKALPSQLPELLPHRAKK